MIKDIPILKVGDLAFAVVPRMVFEEDHEEFWDTYLLNLIDEPIFSVIVCSSVYCGI